VKDVGTGRSADSFGDTFWWPASTISTVGFGDTYSVTMAAFRFRCIYLLEPEDE
jgi:hypothetical protein